MKRVVSTSKVARRVDPKLVQQALGAALGKRTTRVCPQDLHPLHGIVALLQPSGSHLCDPVAHWKARALLAELALARLVEAISDCPEYHRDEPAYGVAADLLNRVDARDPTA